MVAIVSQQPTQRDLADPFSFLHRPTLSLDAVCGQDSPRSGCSGFSCYSGILLSESSVDRYPTGGVWGGLSLFVPEEESQALPQGEPVCLRLEPCLGTSSLQTSVLDAPVESDGVFQPRPTYRPLASRARQSVSRRNKPPRGPKTVRKAVSQVLRSFVDRVCVGAVCD